MQTFYYTYSHVWYYTRTTMVIHKKLPWQLTQGPGPPIFSAVDSHQSSSINQPQKPGFESLVPVTQMLNGAGIVTNICPKNHPNVGKYTVKHLSLPAPTSTTCPSSKKHCVLWDKMHMSMIMAFILQRTA